VNRSHSARTPRGGSGLTGLGPAQGIVCVERAATDAVGRDEDDTIEYHLAHLDDLAFDVVGAPLARAVALTSLELGFDLVLSGLAVSRLNARDVRPGSMSQSSSVRGSVIPNV
jgi:hypothetical protein